MGQAGAEMALIELMKSLIPGKYEIFFILLFLLENYLKSAKQCYYTKQVLAQAQYYPLAGILELQKLLLGRFFID